MLNSYRYFRTSYCHKRNILLFLNRKRTFHEYTRRQRIYKNNAAMRKDRINKQTNIQLREKLKLIIFSSVYFFTCDYIYHLFILNDSKKEKVENKKKCSSNNFIGGDDSSTFLHYVKRLNIFAKPEKVEKEYLQDEKGKGKISSGNKNALKYEHKNELSPVEKNEIKMCNICEDNCSYEIKINRINSLDYKNQKDEMKESNSGKETLTKKKQTFGYDYSGGGNKNTLTGQENNIKDIIANNFYRNDIFNGCNLFLFVNGVVFLSWRLSEIARNKKFFHFMCRHFICSYENIKKKYYHTIFTASISHITVPHFLFNMWAFHTITNTLLCPEIKENKKNYYIFFNYKSNVLEKKINDKDIINVCLLSAIISTIPYILLHKRNQILGASGSIMGLIYLLSTVKPNEIFVSIFPLPYLKMTALQLCHMSILTNFLFLFFKRNNFGIAWSAHLFGMLGGVIYNLYQRKTKNNFNYYPFIHLSIKNGYIDYLNSYLDLVDMLTCLQLQTKLFFSLDPRAMQNIKKKMYSIKMKQSQRRLKFHMLKVKNLEAMSR
ncbi:rhomboid protease ROM6 [Plasmodium brasilianum]|uniref:Rhomboid protease ROM6, putative n=2 Tax=Plasmodium (Plasmodium) TaxID=418103 RepID=A0A1A8W4R6_PLAMA|nr:rhomboid protease ROM6, putative [Plasmodium malariae]KAI4836344.1 rhomboid protease ROM6 [Plasmodium brasilianum]SBS87772.1 rhomboid protease ROM6, putative [Plasmodium malariae]SCO93609.1 rhomboid protease ROM6, putative [Plasmodium malariae]